MSLYGRKQLLSWAIAKSMTPAHYATVNKGDHWPVEKRIEAAGDPSPP
jgi:hypothetical protein